MNQTETIATVAEVAGVSKAEAEHVLKTLGEVVKDELACGGEVRLPGIGKLSAEARPARKGRNPRTGKIIDIRARSVVKFYPAGALKEAVNG